MYSDRKRTFRWGWLLSALLLVAIVVLIISADPMKDVSEESALSVKKAVERCALECYAVEGVYPPSLAYMEENYGLRVNRDDFYIKYEAFASNIAPTVVVTRRHR